MIGEYLSSDRALADFLRTRSPLKVRLENPDLRVWSSAELRQHLYEEETERLREVIQQAKEQAHV